MSYDSTIRKTTAPPNKPGARCSQCQQPIQAGDTIFSTTLMATGRRSDYPVDGWWDCEPCGEKSYGEYM